MQTYIMILTGIMLLFAIVQSIAENMHVKRLDNVHNIITERMVINIAEKKTGQLTFESNKLSTSIRKAFIPGRQQTRQKSCQRVYSNNKRGLLMCRLVNSTTKIVHIG